MSDPRGPDAPGMSAEEARCRWCAQTEAVLEWADMALDGEPVSDFAESFPIVRKAKDLRDAERRAQEADQYALYESRLRRQAEREAERLKHSIVEHFQRDHLAGDGPEIDRWKREAEALRKRLAKAEQTLADVWQELTVCNWHCGVCGADPEMLETDLADTVRAYRASAPGGSSQ